PVAQPPVDGDFADAQQFFGVGDGDHDGIVVVGYDILGGRRLVGGDAAGDAQCLDPGLGPGLVGAGGAVLLGQDDGDGAVVVVLGEPADEGDGVLAGGAGMAAAFGHRHGQFGVGAAL